MILFLTNTYPFGVGEEFIENEIEYIASKHDSVVIFACNATEDAEQTRKLPKNVQAYRCGGTKSQNKVYMNIIRAAFSFKSLLLGEIFNSGSLKKAVLAMNYFGRYLLHLKNCRRAFDRLNVQAGIDLIYSYWFTDAVMVGIFLKNHREALKDADIITRAHRYDLYNEQNKLSYIPFRTYCLENIHRVYCCSLDGRDYMKEKYPVFAEKISHSYLGTRDMGMNTDNEDGSITIVSCSTLTPVKRVHILAECVRKLLDRDIEVKWYCIGDGDEAHRIKSIFSDEEKKRNVFFKGHISNADVLEFYRSVPVSLFVNTSSSEGLPVSIMEAMSFGIPVFATDVGGVNEIVKDGISGMLMPMDITSDELAEAILQYSEKSPDSRRDLRHTAREYWSNNFNAYVNYSKIDI